MRKEACVRVSSSQLGAVPQASGPSERDAPMRHVPAAPTRSGRAATSPTSAAPTAARRREGRGAGRARWSAKEERQRDPRKSKDRGRERELTHLGEQAVVSALVERRPELDDGGREAAQLWPVESALADALLLEQAPRVDARRLVLRERRERLDEDDGAQSWRERVDRVGGRDGEDGHGGVDAGEVVLDEGVFRERGNGG